MCPPRLHSHPWCDAAQKRETTSQLSGAGAAALGSEACPFPFGSRMTLQCVQFGSYTTARKPGMGPRNVDLEAFAPSRKAFVRLPRGTFCSISISPRIIIGVSPAWVSSVPRHASDGGLCRPGWPQACHQANREPVPTAGTACQPPSRARAVRAARPERASERAEQVVRARALVHYVLALKRAAVLQLPWGCPRRCYRRCLCGQNAGWCGPLPASQCPSRVSASLYPVSEAKLLLGYAIARFQRIAAVSRAALPPAGPTAATTTSTTMRTGRTASLTARLRPWCSKC